MTSRATRTVSRQSWNAPSLIPSSKLGVSCPDADRAVGLVGTEAARLTLSRPWSDLASPLLMGGARDAISEPLSSAANGVGSCLSATAFGSCEIRASSRTYLPVLSGSNTSHNNLSKVITSVSGHHICRPALGSQHMKLTRVCIGTASSPEVDIMTMSPVVTVNRVRAATGCCAASLFVLLPKLSGAELVRDSPLHEAACQPELEALCCCTKPRIISMGHSFHCKGTDVHRNDHSGGFVQSKNLTDSRQQSASNTRVAKTTIVSYLRIAGKSFESIQGQSTTEGRVAADRWGAHDTICMGIGGKVVYQHHIVVSIQ